MSAMTGMEGMDMSTNGLFTGSNKAIARDYWYVVAGVLALFTIVRILPVIQGQQRRRAFEGQPSKPSSRLVKMSVQAHATATAIMREIAYPQPLCLTGTFNQYFSPLPVGRSLLLVLYWLMVLGFLWSGTILQKDDPMYAYKWEKVGFRAAWVSVTQIPFIYLLSCKFNIISILTGISYERLNWLHRWAARTVFFTAIVHMSFFLREWWLADMIKLELQMMPMVKYGIGALGVIGWMIFSGFGYFRSAAYEFFVAQHICAAMVLLWLLLSHVPAYARYNIWISIGFVACDWGTRIVMVLLKNSHLLGHTPWKAPGYVAHMKSLPGGMVCLTIEDVDFAWKAGQHLYLSIPRLRPFEVHPFTIANAVQPMALGESQSMTLLIRARSGFTKSLHSAAVRGAESGTACRVFLSGPWGMPPDLLHFETVVLIACASGASFVIPLLEDIVRKRGCVRQATLHWIVQSEEHYVWCKAMLDSIVDIVQGYNMSLQITVHITQSTTYQTQSMVELPTLKGRNGTEPDVTLDSASVGRSSAASNFTVGVEETPLVCELDAGQQRQVPTLELRHGNRPTVEAMIRPPVEAALGETAIIVCGGMSITAQARTFVAAISDERGVHKGSGAQGIFLFTEIYGW